MNPSPDPTPALDSRPSAAEYIPLLLVYLYAVSVCYYQGYWGTLGVDVFNYYTVQDLAKGVVQPLGGTLWLVATVMPLVLLLLLVLSVFLGVFEKYVDEEWSSVLDELVKRLFEFTSPRGIAIRIALFLFVVGLLLYYALSVGQVLRGVLTVERLGDGRLYASYSIFAVGIVALIINNLLPRVPLIIFLLRPLLLSFGMLLPCMAYLDGKGRASQMLHGYQTDYLSPPPPNFPGVYKYLGKAGDYHFLLSRDNKRRLIIPASQLVPLELRQDTASFPDSLLHPPRRRPVSPRIPAPLAPPKVQP